MESGSDGFTCNEDGSPMFPGTFSWRTLALGWLYGDFSLHEFYGNPEFLDVGSLVPGIPVS
jgi:hypothetical protein